LSPIGVLPLSLLRDRRSPRALGDETPTYVDRGGERRAVAERNDPAAALAPLRLLARPPKEAFNRDIRGRSRGILDIRP